MAEGNDTAQITQLDVVGDGMLTNVEAGYVEALADNRDWNHDNLVKARGLAVGGSVPLLSIVGFFWLSLDNGRQLSPASPAKEEASSSSVEAMEDRREDA